MYSSDDSDEGETCPSDLYRSPVAGLKPALDSIFAEVQANIPIIGSDSDSEVSNFPLIFVTQIYSYYFASFTFLNLLTTMTNCHIILLYEYKSHCYAVVFAAKCCLCFEINPLIFFYTMSCYQLF